MSRTVRDWISHTTGGVPQLREPPPYPSPTRGVSPLILVWDKDLRHGLRRPDIVRTLVFPVPPADRHLLEIHPERLPSLRRKAKRLTSGEGTRMSHSPSVGHLWGKAGAG